MASLSLLSKNHVGIWSLGTSAPDGPPESILELDSAGSGNESTFSPDLRTKVDPIHFQDGGKYRSIIKLMIQYKNQDGDSRAFAIGTGWLIADDLLVTAGHCAYDWGNSMGPAVTVKAYMGYSGKASIGKDSVQFRMGKRIITTVGWLQSEGRERTSDVSFIQLDRPFKGNLNKFTFEETPVQGTANLGVVGFPGDKTLDGEHGAEMFEQFANIAYDVEKSKRHMLEYKISTFGGQSGSPVLRVANGRMVSIGAHVYGGGVLNSASTIGGAFGNDYKSMVAAFTRPGKKVATVGEVDVFSPPTAGEPTEGFFDIFEDVAKFVLPIASTALSVATPFLGPIGPVAAIGSVALGALGNMCESSFDESTESLVPAVTAPRELDGCAQRAVLCEAALQTVQKLDPGSAEASQIFCHMEATYNALAPALKVAPKLRDALMAPALRMAIDDLTRPRAPEISIEIRKPLTNVNDMESFTDSETRSLAEALISSPSLVVREEEGFFDAVGPLIRKGFKFATPLLKEGAKFGFGKLMEAVSGSAESTFDSNLVKNDVVVDTLFKRAIMGEAALQAITKFGPGKLEALPLYDEDDQLAAEGFFDSFKTVVQDIGRKVMATAPAVIKAVAPIALNLLNGAANVQQDDSNRKVAAPVTSQAAPPATRQGRPSLAPPSGPPQTRSPSRARKTNGKPAESMVSPMPVSVSALSASGDVLPVEQLVSGNRSRPRRKSTDSNEDGLFFVNF